MALLKEGYKKQEKMNGVVYDMSSVPNYTHRKVMKKISIIMQKLLFL